MNLLTVNNLIVHFNNNAPVVNDLSFYIEKGEIYALVGESGSGKSLTALSIMRLLPENAHVSGNAEFNNTKLFDLPEKQMCQYRGNQISMIFQEPHSALNPVLTIGEHIFESLKLHMNMRGKAARKRAVELLREVALPDPETRIDWYPHQLSGGQKQRAMIAMALSSEPQLLIADEPTTALDVTIQAQILDLLLQLKTKRNLSILIITHDMGIVAKMANRIGVLRHGVLLEETSNPAFFKNPKTEYSKQLIAALPHYGQFRPATDNDCLLEVEDLSVYFPIQKGFFRRKSGHTKAVDHASFTLLKGETTAVVGESGSGKSTLARAILRLEKLTTGRAVFMNQDIHACDKKNLHSIRQKLQVIFQDPVSSMNPRMRVGHIISEGMIALGVVDNHKQALPRISELLQQVGLHEHYIDRFPHEFSGGQRQRIAIARALAVNPTLIICDEPTSALDVSVRAQILQLLDTLQQQHGIAYLFITHDLALIAQIAHRVLVMRDGCIIEQGKTADILQNPQQDYTQKLLSATLLIPTR